jgi:hypothetical protein
LSTTGKIKIPSVNFTSGNFQSEFGPGGKKFTKGRDEKEVLIPPGTFKRISGPVRDKQSGKDVYTVSYVPTRQNTSYLHKVPQRKIAGKKDGSYVYTDDNSTFYVIKSGKKQIVSRPARKVAAAAVSTNTNSKGRKIFKGVKGGVYILSPAGKKIYKKTLPIINASSNSSPFGKNSTGNTIYKGKKGGFFTISKKTGKKSYKFVY